MVSSPLIRPYFLEGGGIEGVPLGSRDWWNSTTKDISPPSSSTFKFPQGGWPTGVTWKPSTWRNVRIAKFLQKRLFEDHEIHISVSYPKRTCSPETPELLTVEFSTKFVFRNKKPSWPGLGKYNYTVPAQALPFIRDFKEPMSELLPLLPKAYWSGSACARWGNSNVERLFRVLRTASRSAFLRMPRGMPSFCFKPFEEDNTTESINGDVKKDFSHSHVNFTNFNHQGSFFR